MSHRLKIFAGNIISPFVIGILKIHTTVTHTERARAIIFNEHDELLLVRGFIGPKWSLPGGAIEKNESAEQAIIREVYEETGIRITKANDIKSIGALGKEQSPVNYTAHIYTVRIHTYSLPQKQFNTREIIELGWFAPDALPPDVSSIVAPSLRLLSHP